MRSNALAGFLLLAPACVGTAAASEERSRANAAVLEILERQEAATDHAVRTRNIDLMNYGIASLHGAGGMAHASRHFDPACVRALSMLHAVMSNVAMSALFDATRAPELNAALQPLRTPESLDGVGRIYAEESTACEKATGLKMANRHLPKKLSTLLE